MRESVPIGSKPMGTFLICPGPHVREREPGTIMLNSEIILHRILT